MTFQLLKLAEQAAKLVLELFIKQKSKKIKREFT